MDILQKELDRRIDELDHAEEFRRQLDDLSSVYPFNEYEYIISSLLGFGKLNLDEYYEIRDEYIARNLYLSIFEISAPRGFGEKWAQGHLKELVPEFEKPSKKNDPSYSGEYDFYLDGKIKIEVKASRAVDSSIEGSLVERALSTNMQKPFLMNFQQVKPDCCDVFVWLAVWRDKIRYWVLSSSEMKANPFFVDKQHRGNTGEGQLHVKDTNISEFAQYEVQSGRELLQAIRNAYNRNQWLGQGAG